MEKNAVGDAGVVKLQTIDRKSRFILRNARNRMRWYSVKKHKPPADYQDYVLIRVKWKSGIHRIEVAHYEGGEWVDSVDREFIEDEDRNVTHFCIPEPIEIEE